MVILFVLSPPKTMITYFTPTEILSIFANILLFYHISEPLLQAYFNPTLLTWDSFLFSKPYVICMVLCLTEFFLEWKLVGELKGHSFFVYLGLSMVVLGEVIRKVAIITAAHNFTHTVQYRRRDNHVLVSHGIYAYIRHPGYLGWFLWTIGNQILLLNPCCLLLFTIVSWNYFADRITDEETQLIQFFGDDYKKYRQKTPTWIPFIR